MKEFNNLYLCPLCDSVGELTPSPITCIDCGYVGCLIARHIPHTTRQRWVDLESSNQTWRLDKTLSRKLKHRGVDARLAKEIQKNVKRLFTVFGQHRGEMDGLFPHFMEDYERTTGKKNRQRNSNKGKSMTKRGSQRGALYEGAFLKIMDLNDSFERCPGRIHPDDTRYNFHPDGWYLDGDEKIPIEFKTTKGGNFVSPKMEKYIKQSRKHGRRAKRFDFNSSGYSILIVCCPEERKFGAVVLSSAADDIVPATKNTR